MMSISVLVKFKTVTNTGSCFGFLVPVVWSLRQFVTFLCNAPAHYTTCLGWVGGGGWTTKKRHITEKGDALQKTGTRNPQTGTRNHKQEPLLLPSS